MFSQSLLSSTTNAELLSHALTKVIILLKQFRHILRVPTKTWLTTYILRKSSLSISSVTCDGFYEQISLTKLGLSHITESHSCRREANGMHITHNRILHVEIHMQH
jgi:hypothetical protein